MNKPDIVERLEDYAEDDYYFDHEGSLVTTNRPIVLREAAAEITRLRGMSTDTREAMDAEIEMECLSAWNASTYGHSAEDTVHPMFLSAFKQGYRASEQASAPAAPARPNIGDRLKAHSGSGKCKVCKTDNCMLTGLGKPSIWNSLKEDEC